jgi:hypothetical protein
MRAEGSSRTTIKTLKSGCRAAAYLNKALQQNRDDVLRYGWSIGCDLLKATVRRQEAQSQSKVLAASSAGV